MYEHERPTLGYACTWTHPNRNSASVFTKIMSDILSQRRSRLHPYMPNTSQIFGEDFFQDEIMQFTEEAKKELGNSPDIVHIAIDMLDNLGRLNLGIFTPNESTAIQVSRTNRGIHIVQFTTTVFQDTDGQFKPTMNPFGLFSSLLG